MPADEPALQLARRHVADGTRLVAEQTARVGRLHPGDVLHGPALKLLQTMELTLLNFKADLARLEAGASDGDRPG